MGVAECAGDRHAVAPVEDVVAVGPFDDVDRRQRAIVVVRMRDALPAVRNAICGGPDARGCLLGGGAGAAGAGGGPRSGRSWRAGDPRVRRLRVPVLPQGVPAGAARRVAARQRGSLRVSPFPADGHPSACAGRLGCRGGGGDAGPVLGDARAAVPSPAGARGRRPAWLRGGARARPRALRRRHAERRGARADPSRRRERARQRRGARHADPVHRRRGASGPLRRRLAPRGGLPRGDAARASSERLAGDEGHAASVLPGGRQDPARHDGAAQPLVERAALRRRPRPHDAPAPSPRHDVRDHARLRRPRRRGPHRRRAHARRSACTTGSPSRSSTGGCMRSSPISGSTWRSGSRRSACR